MTGRRSSGAGGSGSPAKRLLGSRSAFPFSRRASGDRSAAGKPPPRPRHHGRAVATAVAVLLVGILTGCVTRGSDVPRPNVLLVSIDSLRADHVHAYGYPRPTTPTIDALAAGGVLFETALSSSSWTLPAHMTLFTAMPPEEHGVHGDRDRLSADAVTLAEVLRGAGYTTVAFVSGPTMGKVYGFDQGFELYDDRTAVQPIRKLAHRGITSPDLVRLVSGWLAEWSRAEERKPFFLFLHMWDVHYDYAPPPPYDTLFDPDYRGDLTSENFQRSPRVHREMPRRDLEHLIALYDGEIRYTDEHLGQIVAELDRLGIGEETIVVVLSDHGDEFFEHGRKGHAHALYDETIRIVFVLRYPRRVAAGQKVDRQVRLMDVAPTILGLAGVAAPPGFGSSLTRDDLRPRDLTPWIAGGDAGELPELLAFSSSRLFGRNQRSLRTPAYKLIEHQGKESRTELFDLRADPGERHDIARTPRGRALTAHLGAELEEFARAVAGRSRAGRAEIDEDQQERLRALGYVD